jgi:hypothetical protein
MCANEGTVCKCDFEGCYRLRGRFVGAILRLAFAQSLPQWYIRQQNTLPKYRRQTMSLKLHLQTYCLGTTVTIVAKSHPQMYCLGALVEGIASELKFI